MPSNDFIQLLKEIQTCTNKTVMSCFIEAEAIKGKFILKVFAGKGVFFSQLRNKKSRELIKKKMASLTSWFVFVS